MSNSRPITLTESAAGRMKSMLESREVSTFGIRIAIRHQGCSGFTYALEFAEEAYPFDEVVEERGITLVIDPEAIMLTIGTEIDWQDDAEKKGFVFRNPNEASRCDCGQSFRTEGCPA